MQNLAVTRRITTEIFATPHRPARAPKDPGGTIHGDEKASSPELTGKLGDEIYNQDIKRLVEPDHNEEIVAIDVDSRKWALAAEEEEAVDLLRQSHPEAFNILTMRVGSRAVYLMRQQLLRTARD